MQLRVDATDVARGIFHVRQTIPVAKAGTLTLLYPEWLPGKHAPPGAISGLTGLQARACGTALRWPRPPTHSSAFAFDVPEGAQTQHVRSEESRVGNEWVRACKS